MLLFSICIASLLTESVFAQSISTTGRCGPIYGLICTGSTFGQCCSVAGWCGSSSEHCGAGCQPNFGTCLVASSSSAAPIPSTKPVSTNSRCGSKYGNQQCTGSAWGDCCSVFGYCGSTNDFCSFSRCQKDYGMCSENPTTLSSVTGGEARGSGSLTCPAPESISTTTRTITSLASAVTYTTTSVPPPVTQTLSLTATLSRTETETVTATFTTTAALLDFGGPEAQPNVLTATRPLSIVTATLTNTTTPLLDLDQGIHSLGVGNTVTVTSTLTEPAQTITTTATAHNLSLGDFNVQTVTVTTTSTFVDPGQTVTIIATPLSDLGLDALGIGGSTIQVTLTNPALNITTTTTPIDLESGDLQNDTVTITTNSNFTRATPMNSTTAAPITGLGLNVLGSGESTVTVTLTRPAEIITTTTTATPVDLDLGGLCPSTVTITAVSIFTRPEQTVTTTVAPLVDFGPEGGVNTVTVTATSTFTIPAQTITTTATPVDALGDLGANTVTVTAMSIFTIPAQTVTTTATPVDFLGGLLGANTVTVTSTFTRPAETITTTASPVELPAVVSETTVTLTSILMSTLISTFTRPAETITTTASPVELPAVVSETTVTLTSILMSTLISTFTRPAETITTTASPVELPAVVSEITVTLTSISISTSISIFTRPAVTITTTATPLLDLGLSGSVGMAGSVSTVTTTSTVTGSASCPTGNPIVNGGFESSTISPWLTLSAGNGTSGRVTGGANLSLTSYRAGIDAMNPNLPQRIIQPVLLCPGSTYSLGFQMRRITAVGTIVVAGGVQLGSGTYVLMAGGTAASFLFTAAPTFGTLSVPAGTSPVAGVLVLEVTFTGALGTKEVYIDDVILTKTS